MPTPSESTPEFNALSEERRQVLGFFLTYMSKRISLANEYTKKLTALDAFFADNFKSVSGQISKAKSILHKNAPSGSEQTPSFYEALGKLVIESYTSLDKTNNSAAAEIDEKIKRMFQELAVDQQTEVDAIDGTIASLANQQHTMSVKLNNIKADFATTMKQVDSLFSELKKRTLEAVPKSDSVYKLTKPSVFEKKIFDIERERSKKTIKLLKEIAAPIQPDSSAFYDNIYKQTVAASHSYLETLYPDHYTSNVLSCPTTVSSINEIIPTQFPFGAGNKSLLEIVSKLLQKESNSKSKIISEDGIKLLRVLHSQLKESEAYDPLDKSEYEKLRISTYRNKSASASPSSPLSASSSSYISTPLPSPGTSRNRYVALYDSMAESPNELSFSTGDAFMADTDSTNTDEEWIYLTHLSTGNKGYVPRSYVSQG